MSTGTMPEVVGYVPERKLFGLGPTLTIFTTDPSLGEPVANLIRASEHEAIVADLNDELLDERLHRQDQMATAADQAMRQTHLLRAALTWFEQHEKVIYLGGGTPAVDAMKKIAQEIRDSLPTTAVKARGPAS